MKSSTWPAVFSLVAIFLFFSGSAFATWKAEAVWAFGRDNTITYTGIGDSKESALGAAKNACINAQNIDEYKYYCQNKPRRESYSQLPNGTYINSCGNCRFEDSTTKLVCDYCKPVIERRELDTSTCIGDTINHIENCHGTLSCTCP